MLKISSFILSNNFFYSVEDNNFQQLKKEEDNFQGLEKDITNFDNLKSKLFKSLKESLKTNFNNNKSLCWFC